MKNQEEDISHSSPELPPYLVLFHRHLDQLREHLNGATRADNCSPTVVNGVEWESSEKDLFFHALGMYSRLRPDLIAASIETKNEVDVLEYIALLEEALQENAQEDICRKSFPLAHEVSDAWIAWEEENAERLHVNEEIWSASTGGGTNDSGSASSELLAHMDESLRKQPLNNVPYLTYGHMVVIDSILEAYTKRADISVAISPEEGTSSTQSITEVGSISPIRTLQSSASSTLNGSLCSLDKTTSISPEQDLNPSGDGPHNPQDMSPRSRRRYQKRMHMRRKRAQASGGEVDRTTEKLRPGSRRKSAHSRSKSSTVNVVEDQGTESATAVDTATSDLRNPGGDDWISESENTELEGDPPGTTPGSRLPFRIARSELHNCHVNAESIIAGGLDIFNHKKIGKLLRLFISGYESQLIGEDASIRTELLFLLFEILKDFLVQVTSRVITLEEEHHRLRGKTKVWRKNSDEAQNGLIGKSAIQFALKTMGITTENINQYFADLLGEHFDTPHWQTGFDDNERLVASQNVLQKHPLHQDICPPYFHFFLAPDAIGGEIDDLMDVDTDDDGLDDVLHEEEVLDEEDILIDRTHEDTLWNKVPLSKKRSLSS